MITSPLCLRIVCRKNSCNIFVYIGSNLVCMVFISLCFTKLKNVQNSYSLRLMKNKLCTHCPSELHVINHSSKPHLGTPGIFGLIIKIDYKNMHGTHACSIHANLSWGLLIDQQPSVEAQLGKARLKVAYWSKAWTWSRTRTLALLLSHLHVYQVSNMNKLTLLHPQGA